MPHFCPDATKVTPLDDYTLRVEFADGSVKTCDFSDHLNKCVFRKAHAEDGAIVWDDTLDCAPEYVYYHKQYYCSGQ